MPPPDQDTPLDELELRLVDVLDAIDGGATAEEALAKHPEHIKRSWPETPNRPRKRSCVGGTTSRMRWPLLTRKGSCIAM